MSSSGATGVQQGAIVKQKHRPDYSNDGDGRRQMSKDSGLDYTVTGPQTARIKIGIRLKDYLPIDKLIVSGANHTMTVWKETQWPVAEPRLGLGTVPPGSLQAPISEQCESILPTANTGDAWTGFVAKYNPNVHGSRGFDTTIVVKDINLIPQNGFVPVTIVFTTEGIMFGTGHYVVATSVLPGEGSQFAHSSVRIGASDGGKGKKGPSSSKNKSAKSKAAKSKTPKKKGKKR